MGNIVRHAGRSYALLRLKSGEIKRFPCEHLELVPTVESRVEAIGSFWRDSMREPSEPSTQPYSIFKAFEHKAWQTAADQYDAAFSRLTQQAIPSIFEALGLRPGLRLLDAACGPGNLAAAALRLGANVTGVDFSERMVARARMLHPDIEFREGDAESLRDFPDESFDVVAMNFGFHHLEQPENALKAIHRILKPRGRFAFTVWGREETVAGLSLPRKAIALLGDINVLPPGPSPFHFSEPDSCREAYIRCGFADPQTRTVDQTWEFGSPEEYFEAILRSTARTSNLLQRQTPERLTEIRDHVCSAASAYRKAGKVLLPMPANLAWATKP